MVMWSLRMERTREENEKCFMAGDVTKESYKSKGPLELKKLARGEVSLRLEPDHGEQIEFTHC